jgi:hypothetical protein
MPEDPVTPGWDPVWEQIFSSREWGKYPPEHVVRFVDRNSYRVPDRKQVRLLEVGCGGRCQHLVYGPRRLRRVRD